MHAEIVVLKLEQICEESKVGNCPPIRVWGLLVSEWRMEVTASTRSRSSPCWNSVQFRVWSLISSL